MELIKNIFQGQLSTLEGDVWFGLFNKYIAFAIDDLADIKYAESCAVFLNSFDENLVQEICEASIKYCNSFLDAIGEAPIVFKNYKDVLPLIYPSCLLIPDPQDGNEPIVHMELNCEWEEEHGMEWVIKDNSVLYVGAFNGIDPWAEITKNEIGNYA